MDISNMDLSILIALAAGPAHGYAVMQAMRERAGGGLRVSTGSFYRRLWLLMKSGLVEEAPSRKASDPRRGVSYGLTAAGRQALAAERDRLAALVAAVDALRPAHRRGRA